MQSPLSWELVETLLLFGARIGQRNAQNYAPIDLVPELGEFQQFCLQELARIACRSVAFQPWPKRESGD